MTKLKDIIGVEEKRLLNRMPHIGYNDAVTGYNSLANAEVVVDREKIANTILFELQAGKWQLVNTLVNSGDVVGIACAIATAIESGTIIPLKEEV